MALGTRENYCRQLFMLEYLEFQKGIKINDRGDAITKH
jgi:hypothetical protein